jgi:uncharacterized protein (TIGR03437 family)
MYAFFATSIPAEIVYIGAAPKQLSAVTQINVRVPPALGPGPSKISIGSGVPSSLLDFGSTTIYVGSQ